jgi:hypothetical protein
VPEAKPYNIPKQLVWEAYQRVKANRGAAGVDGESPAVFDKDLKGNLYKVWNRMSSGSYFPPPVRLVEIPKDSGGTRPLGIPTVADRVAQTVVKMVLEPLVGIYSPPRTPDDRLTVAESHPRAALARRRTIDESGQKLGLPMDGVGCEAAVERVARCRRIARGVCAAKRIRSAAAAVVGEAPGPDGPRRATYVVRSSGRP